MKHQDAANFRRREIAKKFDDLRRSSTKGRNTTKRSADSASCLKSMEERSVRGLLRRAKRGDEDSISAVGRVANRSDWVGGGLRSLGGVEEESSSEAKWLAQNCEAKALARYC